jgi:Stage II sporulation protein M
MSANEYVLAHGMRDTRATVEAWQLGRWSVLGPWMALSLAIAVALLVATWLVSNLVTADPTPYGIGGVNRPVGVLNFLHIMERNSVVLAFHATACVAGFIAGASMPIAAQSRTGFSRWAHLKLSEFAITYVVGVTLFSLSIQAFVLGFQGAAIASQLQISTAELLLSAAPQALIELTALFLPLAAWVIASRKREWNQLLAATFVTVVVAVPMLLAAALIELFLWPQILIAISPAA